MNNMIAQVESLPELVRGELKVIDERVRKAFDHNEILSTKKIVITGCGDSYFAGMAAKLAFKMWTQLPVDVFSSLSAGRYDLPYEKHHFPNNPMVIGISVSGGVSRTIEAINIANQTGARTVALTGNLESNLAKISSKVIDISIPSFVEAPGVRSYQASLMTLYLIAIHFAEVREIMTMAEADKLRDELLQSADIIEATIKDNSSRIQKLAEELSSESNFHFISHGPNLGTAIFSAAKVVESVGRYALGQDTEEWAHFEYFNNVNNKMPTFVISPGYRTHTLASGFVAQMKRIGRRVIAITPDGDNQIAPLSTDHLPVKGIVREEISPFVYMVAGELFAAYLSDATGEPFFRLGDDSYKVDGDHRKTSTIGLTEILAFSK